MMPGKGSSIQRAAVAEARLQDTLTRRFAAELQESLKLLNRQIRSFVLALKTENGRLVSTQANIGRALQLRQDLRAALQDSGVIRLSAAAIDAPLDRLAVEVMKTWPIAGDAAKLTPMHIEALTALKELRLAELLELTDDVALTVWRSTVDGVLGVRPVEHLLNDIEDALDASHAEARTLYDTAVSSYSRQVEQLHATGDADELFLYAGPADLKTRPFCLERVGKVFTRAEIEDMNNGQLEPVMLTGGGYSCRHSFRKVSVLDDELQGMVGTGKRLPEVEQHLAGVPG